MLLDKIITLMVVIVINYFLFKKYINGYTRINLVGMLISVLGASIYIYVSIKKAELYWYIQILLFLLMIAVPITLYFICNKITFNSNKSNLKNKAEKYLKEKNIDEARKCLDKYLNQNEEDVDTYIMYGMCDKYSKEYESAITNFMKAIELDKKSYKAYYELGVVLEIQGKIDTAIVMLANANKIKPDFYDAAELLGICYTSQKNYSDAEKVYLSALKYHPNSYEMNYNLAIINLERGHIDDAEEYLIKASNLSSKPYGACYSLGNIYYKKSKYQNALENYKIARNSKDLAASSYYKMAIIFCKMREYENASICLKYSVLIEQKYLDKAKVELIFEKIISGILEFEKKVNLLKEKLGEDKMLEEVMNVASQSDFLSEEKIENLFTW